MANTTPSDRSDTSVLFNLQELMRIETERVQANAAAERAAQDVATWQQHERQRLAADAQRQAKQTERDEQQRARYAQRAADTERATALLAARMKLEAEQRAELLHREREHARALELIAAQTTRPSTWSHALWMLGGTLALIVAGYVAIVEPLLEQMRLSEADAVELTALRARELAALRAQAVTPSVFVAAPSTAAPVTEEEPTPSTSVSTKRARPVHVEQRRPQVERAPAIDPFDSDDDDPLFGLGELGATAPRLPNGSAARLGRGGR